MRLVEVIDRCCAQTVTVAPAVSLAETAQAMERTGATAVIVDGSRFDGVLTAGDLLRHLTLAASAAEAWTGPVAAALNGEVATVSGDEPVGRVIEAMTAAGIDHLPVATAEGIVVVSLRRLVLAENALLHGEVDHLQNYIDALHDAPND